MAIYTLKQPDTDIVIDLSTGLEVGHLSVNEWGEEREPLNHFETRFIGYSAGEIIAKTLNEQFGFEWDTAMAALDELGIAYVTDEDEED